MNSAVPTGVLRPRPARFIDRYRAFVAPTSDDLPPLRLLLAFPALLLILGVVLVGLGINGSSSGAFYSAVYAGDDPDLIAGHPQAIRSDEWNVGTVWTIAQVEQGFPARSETFPGGMDAALPYDLPRLEWSVAFRPHQLGYLFLDVDQGTAWRWWLPGLLMIAAGYAFLVSVLPRRPVVAALLSVGFFFSPFFQWWYQSSTFWPVVWALATMASLVWAMKSSRATPRWIWAAIVSYITVVMAMGIYAPFIVPVALVVVFFTLGLVVDGVRRGMPLTDVLRRLVPTAVAAVTAGAVTLGWLATKAATVDAFLSTTYPGQRITVTGTGGPLSVARTISSSFSEALQNSAGFLGINSSEAATFFLVGVFLFPVVVTAIVRQARAGATLPWVLIGLTTVLVVFLAFMTVPNWDLLARVLFLDRSTADRVRIGVGVGSFAILAYVIQYLDASPRRVGRLFSAATAGVYLASQTAIAAAVLYVGGDEKLWGAAPFWWVFVILGTACIYFVARRRALAGAVAFLVLTVASSATVNPVYLGVFDLRDTAASQAIMQTDATSPGTWVGIGDPIVTATLLESGVEAYNGTQGAPSLDMWHQIDPSGVYEDNWNRIGGVIWTPEPGAPSVSNPAPDQVQVTFDACSDFAQGHVDYVLANRALPSACLDEQSSHPTQDAPLTVYRVVAP